MQGDRRTDAGEGVHLARVFEFLFDRDGGGRLEELSKARAGVSETPGRQFDLKIIERCGD
jgi:hypothetical protein